MAQLIYFVSGHHRLSHEQARELVPHAFSDSHFVCAEYSATGPGGDTGCLCGRSDERLGYYADRQTWRPIPGGETPIHVGYWNDAKPTAADLLVGEPLRGLPIKLKDGQEWIVPLAREWTGGDGWSRCLPGVLALDAAGKWISGGIDQQYSRLWDLAMDFWSHLFGGQVTEANELRFNFQGATDAAVEVLSVNYRLSRAEVALLGLLDDQLDAVGLILRSLVDMDRYVAWQKKSLPPQILVGSSISAGGEASPPPTDRRSSTSGRSKRTRKSPTQ